MYPPLFSIASASNPVKAILGASPVRVFPFGSAPDRVTLPYAVWQIASGQPENYISNAPDMDSFVTQVDVYGATESSARDAAEALRDAIEQHAYIVAWRGESKDPESKNFRYSFDVNFLTAR